MKENSFVDCLNQKKCRARFGLEGQSQWCKHCRRKKKCTRFLEEDMSNHQSNPNMLNNYHHSSSINPHGMNLNNHRNPSSVSSPRTNRSDNDDDSMNEPDGDDILARQVDSIEDDDDDEEDGEDDDEHHINDDDSDEENKQQHHHHHHHHQQPLSLVHKPIPSKIESHQGHFQPPAPPPAHLYQPSTLPSHFPPNFHY